MTARESYFKYYYLNDEKRMYIWFLSKIKNDYVFCDIKDSHEFNINKMEQIEKREDFICWGNSDLCKKLWLFKDNKWYLDKSVI